MSTTWWRCLIRRNRPTSLPRPLPRLLLRLLLCPLPRPLPHQIHPLVLTTRHKVEGQTLFALRAAAAGTVLGSPRNAPCTRRAFPSREEEPRGRSSKQ